MDIREIAKLGVELMKANAPTEGVPDQVSDQLDSLTAVVALSTNVGMIDENQIFWALHTAYRLGQKSTEE